MHLKGEDLFSMSGNFSVFEAYSCTGPECWENLFDVIDLPDTGNLSGIDSSGEPSYPVPGRRCPACLERDVTVWVIPGKCCPICGTPVN
jgi:hypothetical protein